jgi:glycosyltransferase involved in cell wall biosynthesis
MSAEPLVTIGLPVYNGERFIRQSLDSLLGQTFRDFRLIVSDNASTDSTAAICQEYAARDPRVVYTRNDHNIGNPRNFNKIANLTTTKYLKWSTADDYWDIHFLEKAVAVMEKDPSIALCYPGAILIDEEGKNPRPYKDFLHLMGEDSGKRYIDVLEKHQLLHQHLGLIRTSALKQTHLLGVFAGSDLNLIAELALYGKFHELPEPMFYRRFHATSGSFNRASAEHQARFYHGRGTDTPFVHWRKQLWQFRSVLTAPLSLASKLRVCGRLVRHSVWNREILVADLIAGVRGQRLHRGG